MSGNAHPILHLKLLIPPPADLEVKTYLYDTLGLDSGVAQGNELARNLGEEKLHFAGLEVVPLSIPDTLQWSRYPSKSSQSWTASDWPFKRYEVQWQANVGSSRFLVGDGLPFYTDSDQAVAQFVYRVPVGILQGARNPQLSVDVCDLTARISRVHIGRRSVSVNVDQMSGIATQLQLRADGHDGYQTKSATQSGRRTLSLPRSFVAPTSTGGTL
jgi:hypothetical protein